MADFVLEVRAEEIPARMVEAASGRLASAFFETLTTRGLPPAGVENHYTVRRLIVRLTGLVEREPDREQEVLGPPASAAWDEGGNPTPALDGFARRCDVEPGDVTRRQTPKGEYAAVVRVVEGKPMADILAEVAPGLIAEMSWSKPMRWGDSLGPWVRPVQGVLALLDGEVVPFEVFGIQSGNRTIGHPILSPQEFAVRGWGDYLDQLGERGVVVDGGRRLQMIEEGFRSAAEELGGTLPQDEALLERLAAMVEVPGIVVGRCDPTGLPREVLTASLRDHQNAFGIVGENGPLPAFLTVMDRADDPQELVRQGNEWVVAARLEDARFFVTEDRKRTLEERRPDLERLTFHQALGSYADKAGRLVDYGVWLCNRVDRGDLDESMRAAAGLAKVDLTCEVVREFTGLQGVMGGVYAREQSDGDEVAAAIYEHYRPVAADDPIPETVLGRLLSIADRMVTLGGFFAIGETPSGSRDPYALRRAAQGVVEIILGGELPVDLEDLSGQAVSMHSRLLAGDQGPAVAGLKSFLKDRLSSLLGRRGFAYDEVAAAVAVDALPVAAQARVQALHLARQEEDFVDVADAAKRIRNILAGQSPAAKIDPELLHQEEEKALWQAVAASRKVVESTTESRDYAAAIEHIAGYASPLENFFDQVLVMDEDEAIRANRLALLAEVDRLFRPVGDLSLMAVQRRGEKQDQ